MRREAYLHDRKYRENESNAFKGEVVEVVLLMQECEERGHYSWKFLHVVFFTEKYELSARGVARDEVHAGPCEGAILQGDGVAMLLHGGSYGRALLGGVCCERCLLLGGAAMGKENRKQHNC